MMTKMIKVTVVLVTQKISQTCLDYCGNDVDNAVKLLLNNRELYVRHR